MSFHVLETIRAYGSFYKFHAVEQVGESIHRRFKPILEKWWHVKNDARRVWGIISEFQAKNNLTSELNGPAKRNKASNWQIVAQIKLFSDLCDGISL